FFILFMLYFMVKCFITKALQMYELINYAVSARVGNTVATNFFVERHNFASIRFNKDCFFEILSKRILASALRFNLSSNSFAFSSGSQSMAVHIQFLRSLLTKIS